MRRFRAGAAPDNQHGNRVSGVDFTPLGLAVGHATDESGGTGLTIVRHLTGAMRGAAVVVGRATGSRELYVASPDHVTDRVDAVMLTGGSAYGLDAAAGVMRWMEARGRGFPVGPGVVPLVPAAVIFDLTPFGRYDARPTPEMAWEACETATASGIAEGSVGAGTGATVGKVSGPERAMKGGVGCWLETVNKLSVGAVAVVNAFGDVRDGSGSIIAGTRGPDGAFVDSARLVAHAHGRQGFAPPPLQHTTIAVVATNGVMPRVELRQLASAATAALYRRITPTGTTLDGDVVFALCPHEGTSFPTLQVEALAVRVLETAIERAVRLARGRDGIPGLADGAATGS
ncbi:MAG TPA: P1 family peptidase [Gemmatimonadaceae bacterium]|nr:P1 family peptidase [Gemmatimonadaceae bacterium]